MPQYFYTKENKIFGPFTKEVLKEQLLSRNTKIWFYGLDTWTEMSEIDELRDVINAMPPDLLIQKHIDTDINIIEPELITNTIENNDNKETQDADSNKSKYIKIALIISTIVILAIVLVVGLNRNKNARLHKEISLNSYSNNTDFQFYVDKFFRDAGIYGIYPKKPEVSIIKFSKLDQMKNTTHLHGVSFGINNDDKIEIYINPSSWEKFNKPMRYYLMYHELAHDVLNLEDLDATLLNKGKLMYPEISDYNSLSMDDFIENSHALFEEVANK